MQSSSSLAPVAPIIFLAIAIAAINWIDLARGKGRTSVAYPLSLLTSLVLIAWFAMNAAGGETHYVFANLVVIDPMANVLSAFCSLGMLLTLIYTRSYLSDRDMLAGEFYMLSLFTLGGQLVMITGNNFLTLYLGLELLSLSSYALVALRRDSRVTSESAIKYFVLGALASGFLLYGMSMMYGATGSLNLAEVFRVVESGRVNTTMLAFGVVFIVAGVSFKLGAAPFHMWLPDVYQGAPTPVTMFISAAPKLAAFGMAFRLLQDGVGPAAEQWQWLLAGLAAASLVIGNVIAIAQTNLKRMLAYSTVSHVGFLLVGFAGGGEVGYSAALFYGISYAIMSAAAFGAIIVLSRQGFEADRIDDFKGLNARNPWQAGLVLCVMASLAGVPPFLGFWAKLVVLGAAVNGGFLWLAIVGVLCAVIGAFYYLRVIKVMYFDEPVGEIPPPRADRVVPLVFGVNALALLVLGVAWNPIMAWCKLAFAG